MTASTDIWNALESTPDLEAIAQADLPEDIHTLAVLLSNLDRLAKAVRHAKREVMLHLHSQMTDKTVVIDGWGSLERKGRSRNIKWDHARLAGLVSARAVERWSQENHGERPEEYVTQALMDCAGIAYWRLGKLKANGVEAAQIDACQLEVTYGDPGVRYWLAADPARDAVRRMTDDDAPDEAA